MFDLSQGMGHPHHPYAPLQQMERSSCLSYEYLLAQEGNDTSDALTPHHLVSPPAPPHSLPARVETDTVVNTPSYVAFPAPQRSSTHKRRRRRRLARSTHGNVKMRFTQVT